jgi:glutamine synthetase
MASFKAVSVAAPVQEDLLKKIGALLASAYKNLGNLEAATARAQEIVDTVKRAEMYRDKVATAMKTLRTDIDALEMIVPRDMWPVPTYADLLFKL